MPSCLPPTGARPDVRPPGPHPAPPQAGRRDKNPALPRRRASGRAPRSRSPARPANGPPFAGQQAASVLCTACACISNTPVCNSGHSPRALAVVFFPPPRPALAPHPTLQHRPVHFAAGALGRRFCHGVFEPFLGGFLRPRAQGWRQRGQRGVIGRMSGGAPQRRCAFIRCRPRQGEGQWLRPARTQWLIRRQVPALAHRASPVPRLDVNAPRAGVPMKPMRGPLGPPSLAVGEKPRRGGSARCCRRASLRFRVHSRPSASTSASIRARTGSLGACVFRVRLLGSSRRSPCP